MAEGNSSRRAALRELELAREKGSVVPVEAVLAMVEEPLEAIDQKLLTVHRTEAKPWAKKCGVTQPVAMTYIRDLVEVIRAAILEAIEDSAGAAP